MKFENFVYSLIINKIILNVTKIIITKNIDCRVFMPSYQKKITRTFA